MFVHEVMSGLPVTVRRETTVKEALAHPGPVVVECVVDANEPPLPPKVEFEQGKHFAEAIARGTPGGADIVKTVMKDKIRELI